MGARLGPYNLALVACYTAPTWGAEAIKALTSPYGGLIDPVHAAAAVRLPHRDRARREDTPARQ